MAQLTAPLFAAYAPTLFDSYNQNTDALVWWFARQNDSVQTQVINGICSSTHPIDTIIETFWGLNSTYLLSSYVQNQMVQCIASISSPQIVTTYLTENYITGSLIFGWDSFTPKAYIWFNTQRDTDKILAVNWLCNSGKPTRLVNNTLRYYQSGNSVYNASVSQGMKLCQNMLPFMQSSLQNSTQHWFQNQTYSIQRPAILRICSNSYFNLTTVKASFRFLMDGLQSPSVQNDVDACLSTYRLNYKLQYYYYTPTAPQSLVWFASQNITTQKRAINYICSGTPGSFIKVQTITEMFDTFQKIGVYLEATGLITYPVLKQIFDCQDYYDSMNYSKAYSLMDTTSMVWLASQNESTQADYINQICYDNAYNASDVFGTFQGIGHSIPMLPSSVQYSMILCPKVRASSQLYFSFMYIFIGLGSFAATCFLVFVGWTVYEWRISHKTDKHSRALTPFNILLGICLISNVIHDGTYAMVWFISEVIYVTMIQHDFERHVRYLASEIFLATWAMAYLGYCWVRSETILKRVWTTKLRWVKRAFVVAPFFILSPSLFQAVKITIPQTFGMQTTFNTASYWLQAVSAAALLMMDILLFYTFQAYVSGLSEENSLFLLISRYGIGFSSCCFCYSVLSLTKPFLKSETVYIKIALSIVMHIVSFLMLVMKIHLFFVNKEELSPAQLGRRMSRQIEQSKARMDTESSSSTGKASVQMQLGRDRVGSLASVGSGKTEVTSSPAVRKYSTKTRPNSMGPNGLRLMKDDTPPGLPQ